jgi:hypothetical protein
MVVLFSLFLQGTKFNVPKDNLSNFFEHHPELVKSSRYDVQSPISFEIFKVFVKSLETGTKITVTKANASELSLLAQEFWLDGLLSECSAVLAVSASEFITTLFNRISKLENKVETLRSHVSSLQTNLTRVQADCEELRSTMIVHVPTPTPLSVPIFTLGSDPPAASPKQFEAVVFALPHAQSLDGIISYLTRKHGGNVHDKGAVTITSKSHCCADPRHNVKALADLTNLDVWFSSGKEPDQWVCWNFHHRRIRPTSYTIQSKWLRSWVLESSLDGVHWVEIDRRTGIKDLERKPHLNTFSVFSSAECRLIRLMQTGNNCNGENVLAIYAFEVFGTLLE